MCTPYDIYRATLCVSAVFAVARCLSVTLVYCHRRQKRGVCRRSDTPNIYVWDIDPPPLEKSNTLSYKLYMQHVREMLGKCWERQSDGREYKITLWRPGLDRRGPRWGSLQRFRTQTPYLWRGAGCPLPKSQEPHIPRSRPFGPRSPLLRTHSKISSDDVVSTWAEDISKLLSRSAQYFNIHHSI